MESHYFVNFVSTWHWDVCPEIHFWFQITTDGDNVWTNVPISGGDNVLMFYESTNIKIDEL